MTPSRLEVILSPIELEALSHRDLRNTTCVVFDILRATTSMITALGNGAQAIIPTDSIEEALEIRARQPDALLAGERHGLRIRADLTGGTDFDLGNSPREFSADRVKDRIIVMTTTNGTRALRACAGASVVFAASFLNLGATCNWLRDTNSPVNSHDLVLVCAGTVDEPAFEDILAAGAVCDQLWTSNQWDHVSDSAEVARQIYLLMQSDLQGAFKHANNGRRLLANPDLRDDVEFCARRETHSFVARLGSDGHIRKLI